MKEQLELKIKMLQLQREANERKIHNLDSLNNNINVKIERLYNEIKKLEQSNNVYSNRSNSLSRSNNF